jgi:hypothetical protein
MGIIAPDVVMTLSRLTAKEHGWNRTVNTGALIALTTRDLLINIPENCYGTAQQNRG